MDREYRERKTVNPTVFLASIPVPGLGQILAGYGMRGSLILVTSLLMVGLIYWGIYGGLIVLSPPMIVLLSVFTAIFLVVNVLDARGAARHKPLRSSYLLVVAALFMYVMGWRITQIDGGKFVREFPRTFQIIARVAWPWEVAFDREQVRVSGRADFAIPCGAGDEIPPIAESQANGPWVSVDPTCGLVSNFSIQGFEPGTEITLKGGGFEPNTLTEIWWRDPIGNEFRPTTDGQRAQVTTDESGEFSITFLVPQVTIPSTAAGIQINKVEARQVSEVGTLRPSDNMKLAFARLIETIFLALMATSFGIIFAVPVSFLAARNLMSATPVTLVIYYAVRGILNIFRSIEPLIWAVIGVAWVGLGPFAGVIALTVHSIASLGKLYSEAIESIDPGPIEAVQATGATWLQTVAYAVVPQIVPPFMSFTIYRWDINVRMSTIIGAVGGGGIGFLLFQWIRLTDWDNAGIGVWMIAITVIILDYASAELRKRFI